MHDKGNLRREFGVGFGLAVVVGAIVGEGILRSPGIVAQATADPIVIAGLWILGAVVAMLSALAYAELGAAIPDAGGEFAIVKHAMGEKMGILVGLTLVVIFASSLALMCYVLGEFLFELGVGGGKLGPGTLGMASMALFAAINATGTKSNGFVQILLSTLKGIVVLGLIIALFSGPEVAAPAAVPEPLRAGWFAMGAAIMATINSYAGYQNIVYFGEEFQDTGRQLPLALFGGIAVVGAVFLLINLAMLHVMTPDQMAGSVLVAADAIGIVYGDNAALFTTAISVLLVATITIVSLTANARVVFALGRARILPEALSVVDRRGTPYLALLALAFASGLLILTDSYLALQSMVVTINQAPNVLMLVCVLILRRKEPGLNRPYRSMLYPWSIILALVINIALTMVFLLQDPFYSISGFVMVGVLWAIFEFMVKLRGKTAHMPERLE